MANRRLFLRRSRSQVHPRSQLIKDDKNNTTRPRSDPSLSALGKLARSLGESFRGASMSKQGCRVRRRVRFDATKDSVFEIPRENCQELWWTADELAITQDEDVQLLSSGETTIEEYIACSDLLHEAVTKGQAVEVACLARVTQGLDLGYRGLERWSDTGRNRRLRARSIVRKVVELDGECSINDWRSFYQNVTKDSASYALVSAEADAAVACC